MWEVRASELELCPLQEKKLARMTHSCQFALEGKISPSLEIHSVLSKLWWLITLCGMITVLSYHLCRWLVQKPWDKAAIAGVETEMENKKNPGLKGGKLSLGAMCYIIVLRFLRSIQNIQM